MPRRHPASPDATKATLHGLAPELGLLGAVIQQALADTRSSRADVRQDALQFLEDAEAVAWWGDVLGIGEALLRQVRMVLRDSR